MGLIEKMVKELAGKIGGKALLGEFLDLNKHPSSRIGLLDEVTDLVEYPSAVLCRFDEYFLKIPQDVLITAMQHHQRFFPVADSNDKLMPYFIAVHNGNPGSEKTIRHGYEQVIIARFRDAEFYLKEDTAHSLSDNLEKLRKVVWQADLGTLYEKTERLEKLTEYIAGKAGFPDAEKQDACRAARLCKADLVTEMVKEFTELQGVIGQEYAMRSGEKESVNRAIFEHYLPKSNLMPESDIGAVVSIAEKVDNLTGCFGIGLIPTGSADPYALRRQAFGLIKIMCTNEYRKITGPGRTYYDKAKFEKISLTELWSFACELYGNKLKSSRDKLIEQLNRFMRQRLEGYLSDEYLPAYLVNKQRSEDEQVYDIVNAVLETGFDVLPAAVKRAVALVELKQMPDFEKIVVTFSRASNILPKKYTAGHVDPGIQSEPEKQLWQKFTGIKDDVRNFFATGEYIKGFDRLSELCPEIDIFFDKVLVMDTDEKIRNNHLNMLFDIDRMFRGLADFAKLVFKGKKCSGSL